jgi:hypothetical protein
MLLPPFSRQSTLFLDYSENEGNKILQNVGTYKPIYNVHVQEDWNLHKLEWENLKPRKQFAGLL